MSGGLVALLDDIAAIAKVAAASLDDIGAAAGQASAKAVGVVVDDTAVTPQYVRGFAPERELPIIWRIAKGSLVNKVVFILPVALLLSQVLPQAMTPLLMLGGVYLCFEGAEKVYEALGGHAEGEHTSDSAEVLGTRDHEETMVKGAIRTDFILSAEIMAISLAEVTGQPLLARALILVVVAVMITALVYGVVALIVKMDDFGLRLAQGRTQGSRALGRGLVQAMPIVMQVLSVVGTAAMLWVGGHIIIDGLDKFGVSGPAHFLHELSHNAGHAVPHALSGVVAWLVETLGSGLLGIMLGALVVLVLHLIPRKH